MGCGKCDWRKKSKKMDGWVTDYSHNKKNRMICPRWCSSVCFFFLFQQIQVMLPYRSLVLAAKAKWLCLQGEDKANKVWGGEEVGGDFNLVVIPGWV